MADPRFDIRMSAYERNKRAENEHDKQAKAQRDALQAMYNFHYRDRAPANAYALLKPRTNPIGIPLIRQSGRYYD